MAIQDDSTFKGQRCVFDYGHLGMCMNADASLTWLRQNSDQQQMGSPNDGHIRPVNKAPETIVLGRVYRDRISGFVGVAVSSTRYLWGCDRVFLSAIKTHDGKVVDGACFDLHQLVLDEEHKDFSLEPGSIVISDPGGPGDIAPARTVPSHRSSALGRTIG